MKRKDVLQGSRQQKLAQKLPSMSHDLEILSCHSLNHNHKLAYTHTHILPVTMPCTIVAKFEDHSLERDHPNATAPSLMTLIDYTLKIECNVLRCGHPPELAEDLVLDFEEQGASYTHQGTSYVAGPIGENFTYLGPLKHNLLTKKGTLTMRSEGGWLSMKLTTGRTTGRSQGGRVKDGGSTNGGEETNSAR